MPDSPRCPRHVDSWLPVQPAPAPRPSAQAASLESPAAPALLTARRPSIPSGPGHISCPRPCQRRASQHRLLLTLLQQPPHSPLLSAHYQSDPAEMPSPLDHLSARNVLVLSTALTMEAKALTLARSLPHWSAPTLLSTLPAPPQAPPAICIGATDAARSDRRPLGPTRPCPTPRAAAPAPSRLCPGSPGARPAQLPHGHGASPPPPTPPSCVSARHLTRLSVVCPPKLAH